MEVSIIVETPVWFRKTIHNIIMEVLKGDLEKSCTLFTNGETDYGKVRIHQWVMQFNTNYIKIFKQLKQRFIAKEIPIHVALRNLEMVLAKEQQAFGIRIEKDPATAKRLYARKYEYTYRDRMIDVADLMDWIDLKNPEQLNLPNYIKECYQRASIRPWNKQVSLYREYQMQLMEDLLK